MGVQFIIIFIAVDDCPHTLEHAAKTTYPLTPIALDVQSPE